MSKTDEDLRQEAFQLLDEGWSSAEVAELLEIKTMTVAGWMSWRTRGHYDETGVTSQDRTHEVQEIRALLQGNKSVH